VDSPEHLPADDGLERRHGDVERREPEVVWEMALKGWAVMFCPPLHTWNLVFLWR
jgi:hypothetical protein